ncbi:MAG: acyl transferase [Bergeyella zoohelcum]|nr:acyl transferase [Bergeyella zoohelcum]
MEKAQDIFNIKTEADFLSKSLEVFHYQYHNVEVYRKFVDYLGTDIGNVKSIEQIPFLPIEMYKKHQILDKNKEALHYFQSSGTTNIQSLSRHYIADFSLYEQSIYESFSRFIGRPEDYIFLGLLPNYLENQHSSLIYMIDFLMKKSNKPQNGYFLYNHKELLDLLVQLKDKKVILFGVSFALLDFLDFCEVQSQRLELSPETIVIETGGMKGRKTEMTKDELLEIFQKGFGTSQIFSEYSMTELLSQAYSLGQNIYETPSWMRILIRNIDNPLGYVEAGRTGAVNIIDLANRHSCSFIATQDLGRLLPLNNTDLAHRPFQILGRIDHSDIRGCSLLVS